MKKQSWVCLIALVLCLLCSAAWADSVASNTDVCAHTAGWWNNNDTEHYFVCENCDAQDIKKGPHNFDTKKDTTTHWKECKDCGYTKDITRHIALCSRPGVCKTCGYEDAGMEAPHQYGYWADGALCIYGCPECKEEYWVSTHYAKCNNTGVCVDCGAKGNFRITHNAKQEYDSTYHYSKCSDCSTVVSKSKHYATCRKPDKCQSCGYTGTIAELTHFTQPVSVDATGHREECLNCEYKEEMSGHWAYCSNPTVCDVCGYKGTIALIGHTGEGKHVSDGASGHHYEYSCCGEEGEVNDHWADCSNPTVCDVCGYKGTIARIGHTGEVKGVSDGASGHHDEYSCCGKKGEAEDHFADCSNPTVCMFCDYKGTIANIGHTGEVKGVSDGASGHHDEYSCCGEEGEFIHHWADCSNPTVCERCGYKGTMASISHAGEGKHVSDGASGHHYELSCCGEKSEVEDHWALCSNPTVCKVCGYKGEMLASHREKHVVSDGEAGHHEECSFCGKKEAIEIHQASCSSPTLCQTCGYEGKDMDVSHNRTKNVARGADGCQQVCLICNENINDVESHYAYCSNRKVCINCGYKSETPIEEIVHRWPSYSKYSKDETQHWFTCAVCKQDVITNHWTLGNGCGEENAKCENCSYVFPAEHTWKVVSADKPHQEKCISCAKTRTTAHVAACDAPGVCKICGLKNKRTPVEPHDWAATGTKDGETLYTCSACGATTMDATIVTENGSTAATDTVNGEVHTHTWGAFAINGNGTHARTCTVCDETSIAACTLASTKLGSMDASACIYCGCLTWDRDGAVQAKQVSRQVENATFALLDDDGMEIPADNVTLVVYEARPEESIQLDTGANVLVKKALTISLLEDDKPIALQSSVKLSIPVVEEEVTGLKLLVMDENGQLVEVAYEIIDGEMIFETNILGIFLLVEEN